MKIHLIISLFVFSVVYSSCSQQKEKAEETAVEDDIVRIKETKKLTMLTLSSSYSYFIYKDEAMGYDYDLAKDFCNHYGFELDVKVAENPNRLLEMLGNGVGDLIAYPVTVRNDLKDSVIYCGPERISRQVLIQRANKNDTIIRDVADLLGKEIYVKHSTQYHQRLVNLDAELGNGIIIRDVEKDTITTEDLIEMVSKGEIRYTVADDYIAKLNRTYYRNIDIWLQIGFDQRSSWVVRKNSPELARMIDEWVRAGNNTPVYRGITKKYFEQSKNPYDIDDIPLPPLAKGNLSPFDHLFKKHARSTNFDWRLLAAIAFQESRFETELSSWAGAVGLMGLMPKTAVSLGITVEDRTDPDLSIMAGVLLLQKLEKLYMGIEDRNERMKFVIAAYNGGNGHIADARALTRKYGGDPNVWNSVEKYVLLKSKPEYYNDPVCKCGYFRGSETSEYVKKVNDYWRVFRQRYH